MLFGLLKLVRPIRFQPKKMAKIGVLQWQTVGNNDCPGTCKYKLTKKK